MSLFGKRKKEVESGSDAAEVKETPVSSTCNGEKIEGVSSVKVLGFGCKNCRTLFENAQEAVKAAGLHIEVEYVADLQQIMKYGATAMPALVVNEQVVSMGRVLKSEDIKKRLAP